MLTFHFWGSAEDGEKGAGLAHPMLVGFGGCSCPWFCRDPHSGTVQGGHSLMKGLTMLPKRGQS